MLEAGADTRGWTKERVLRVMLDPEYGLPAGRSLLQVSKDAGSAYGWVHRIWRDLVDAGAFHDHPKSGQLQDPPAAFQYWLRHRPPRIMADYHVLGGLDFLKSIAQRRDLEYAATTYLAENLIQGHLFPRRFDLYVKAAQEKVWSSELRTKGFPIDSTREDRGVIRLITNEHDDRVPDEVAPIPDRLVRLESRGAWNNPIRGIWVVRPPLLIVDLFEEGGACAEAASMLMEKTYANTTVHRT